MAERAASRAAGWAGWALGALFFAYAFFQRVAPSVMVDDLMRDFDVGGAVLGNLSAFYFYAYAGLQIPVGMLVDRWGPRRMLSAMAAVAGLGSLLFAAAESLVPAYAGRFLIGAGSAFGFVATLTLATAWFPPRRFALLTGLTMFAGMAGGMLGQAPLAAVVEAAGWRGTLLGASGFAFALAALLWFVVRDRPPESETRADDPSEGKALSGAAAADGPSILRGLGLVLTRPRNWLLAVFGGLMSAPMLAFGALWGVPYVMTVYGVSRPAAALTVSVVLVGWAVGGPFAGWASDRLGRRRAPLAAGALVALGSLLAILYLPGLSLPVFAGLLFVNGVSSSAIVICYALARELNPGETVATAYGFVNMVIVGSGALFQPVIGWLLDLNWDGATVAGARVYTTEAYGLAFAVLPAALGIALAAALAVPETRCRPMPVI